ncbi:bucky ball [Brachyistius frenatus]|uniref:bucky ball n=1 Tax=Brachyistius frenatus TaxID=100188 RepID=UPI0037E84B51
MDDASRQPQSFGSGPQRGPHPRPFFYVQPPSQPYYLYQQWQLNPYNQYGLPGGFNFGRPCMPPYQYMQYPGFVLPHAPIYPMDYRRMFEPRYHAPTWGDLPQQQQQPQQQPQQQQPQQPQQQQQQPHEHREMACSEAQTDPSGTITKLIECLDKIRASEMQGADRELDSGVASQSSGMFSPGEKKQNEEQGHVLASAPHGSAAESPAVTVSGCAEAAYVGESGQTFFDALGPQDCWSGGLEEELPLDSSSVHEEFPELEQQEADEHFLPLEKGVVMDIRSDISVTDQSVPKCDAVELLESTPSLSFSSIQESKSQDKISKAEHPAASFDEAKADESCQILKLPFESAPTPASPERLSSPTTPYYYNYLSMQTTHERMSVLSPSLDELSSRDEMFSTDLDDMDLFPKRVYPGRKLTEVDDDDDGCGGGGSPRAAEEVEEVWLPGSKRFVCACCGKSLAKGTGRTKAHSSKKYRDEAGDSDSDGRYRRGCELPVRVAVKKHSATRKTHSVPLRHAATPWSARGQYKKASDPMDHDIHKQEKGETEEVDGQERLCREDVTAADQGRWADGGVIPRRRPAATLQRQDMSTQWKVLYHRPRDEDRDDDEPPPSHWERGSTMRGEPRC